MKPASQVVLGVITAVVALVLTIGAFALSTAEGALQLSTSTLAKTPTVTPSISLTTSPTAAQTTSTPLVLTPTETPSPSPTSTSCPPPPGWLTYTIQNGDTLESLSVRYMKTPAEISQANCLVVNALLPGTTIYLPPVPTRSPVPCGRPAGWVIYIVQPGDNLYRLSQAYGVTVTQLQKANCLSGYLIRVGQTLYVPPWMPVFTPTYPPVFFDQTPETPVPSETVDGSFTAAPTWTP